MSNILISMLCYIINILLFKFAGIIQMERLMNI